MSTVARRVASATAVTIASTAVIVSARPVLESSVMRPCVAPLVGLDMSPVAPIVHAELVAAVGDLPPAAR